MTKAFLCDQCSEYNTSAPFEVYQAVEADEDDEDGGTDVLVLHFCGPNCLAAYAMEIALDFPEQEATNEAPS